MTTTISDSGILFNDGTTIQSAINLGLRNRIINGCCRVSQRGNVAAVNNTATYGGADRIIVAPTSFTTASGTIQQVSGAATLSGYAQALLGVTTTGSGFIDFAQRIEALNSRVFNGQTATISAKVYQDTGSTVTMNMLAYKANASDNFGGGVTQVGSTVTASVPTGTWTTITGQVVFGATDGSNGVQWNVRFTGIGAITSKNFYVGDWQVELGSTATPFEQRPYGLELALCQRYYQFLGGALSAIWIGGSGIAASTFGQTIQFPAMRVAPTAAKVGTWTVSNCPQPSLTGASTQSLLLYTSPTTTAYFNAYTSNATDGITLTAEL